MQVCLENLESLNAFKNLDAGHGWQRSALTSAGCRGRASGPALKRSGKVAATRETKGRVTTKTRSCLINEALSIAYAALGERRMERRSPARHGSRRRQAFERRIEKRLLYPLDSVRHWKLRRSIPFVSPPAWPTTRATGLLQVFPPNASICGCHQDHRTWRPGPKPCLRFTN